MEQVEFFGSKKEIRSFRVEQVEFFGSARSVVSVFIWGPPGIIGGGKRVDRFWAVIEG